MKDGLRESLAESYILTCSTNEDELVRDQDTLLNVLQKIYMYLIEDTGLFITICWEIVILIVKRGEFLLLNIGFNQRQII